MYAGAGVACTTPWHLLQHTWRGLINLSACYQVLIICSKDLWGNRSLWPQLEAPKSHFFNVNLSIHLKCPHTVSLSQVLRFTALITDCFVHHSAQWIILWTNTTTWGWLVSFRCHVGSFKVLKFDFHKALPQYTWLDKFKHNILFSPLGAEKLYPNSPVFWRHLNGDRGGFWPRRQIPVPWWGYIPSLLEKWIPNAADQSRSQ